MIIEDFDIFNDSQFQIKRRVGLLIYTHLYFFFLIKMRSFTFSSLLYLLLFYFL